MIGLILETYAQLLEHYHEQWKNEKIDRRYKSWEEGLEMREDLGFEEDNFRRIPKRKIRNRAARKKHGY